MNHDPIRIVEKHIHQYIRAKDENRPHLMPTVFAPQASLEMIIKTETIYFPAVSLGLPAISDVLVSHFAQKYENVYTFCVGRPEPGGGERHYHCDWMVGMSEKATGMARLGEGRYDWHLSPDLSRVERLVITIESMRMLSRESLAPLLDWLATLPYPFCPMASLDEGRPRLEPIEEVVRHLAARAEERRRRVEADPAARPITPA